MLVARSLIKSTPPIFRTVRSVSKVLETRYPFYLNNEPIYANEDLKVKNKYTLEVATTVAEAKPEHIEKAIQGAVNARESMAELDSFKRKEILLHVVSRVKERFEEFAHVLCIEAGKPIKDARGEVSRLIDTFTIAAEESVRIYGEWIPLDISDRAKGLQCISRRFPIGPVSMISPFNFPLNLTAHKIAPAIAAGCPFVLKPASFTPVSAMLLGAILAETDLPKGSFSILPCPRDAARAFTEDERFKLLSFTGSPSVGWKLKEKAGKKKVVLELGGNAACVIDEEVNKDQIDNIVDRLIFGALYQSGQSCISVQRALIHASIYDQIKDKLVSKISKLKMGDPRDENTFIGPIISETEAERIDRAVQDAIKRGAKVLCGGKRNRQMYEATVLENVPLNCDAYSEEIFGPVVVLEKYTSFKDAIDAVNNSKYGLNAGIFTNNVHKVFYAYKKLEVGSVIINDVPSIRVDNQPYGGVKDSGIGREGIKYAIEDMTEIKALVMKNIGSTV
jgi:acyl-CoA reductase-like NAD-dependent aldehyde dehydrogenase